MVERRLYGFPFLHHCIGKRRLGLKVWARVGYGEPSSKNEYRSTDLYLQADMRELSHGEKDANLKLEPLDERKVVLNDSKVTNPRRNIDVSIRTRDVLLFKSVRCFSQFFT